MCIFEEVKFHMVKLRDGLRHVLNTGGFQKREITGNAAYFSLIIGAFLTIFVFYTAFHGVFVNIIQNSIVLCLLCALSFIHYPCVELTKIGNRQLLLFDKVLVALSFLVLGWTLYSFSRFETRIPMVSDVLIQDKIIGVLLVFLVLESCRRTAGIIVTGIACLSILYAFAGPFMPAMLRHLGFSFDRFTDVLYMTTDGLFGSLIGLIATILFAFISFGVFLQHTGADKCFMDVAFALAGKKPGGPAKVAVLSSALMGMISGSSVANIVTTGSLTIPMMKDIGYQPEEAAAVEACASSGGQIMPPIMGAGVFLMADALGVSVFDIAILSFAPAILYFCSLWYFNDKIAKKRHLSGMKVVPSLKDTVKKSLHMWLPIIILIYMCCMKFSPFFSASVCTTFILIFSMIYEKSFRLLKKIMKILESCAVAMTSIVGIMGCAAIIVAIINQTGLMIKSTSIILSLSGGNVILTVLILFSVSYVMGMGLPVTSCYVILAALGVPALVKCGVYPMGAHLMLFWSSLLAGITPPVCVSAYVAANVAGADPMKTGFTALKLGSMFYLIPLLFLFSNILRGNAYEIMFIFAVALLSIYFYVVAIEGFYFTNLNLLYRFVAFGIFLLSGLAILNIFDLPVRGVMLFISIILSIFFYFTQKRQFQEIF